MTSSIDNSLQLLSRLEAAGINASEESIGGVIGIGDELLSNGSSSMVAYKQAEEPFYLPETLLSKELDKKFELRLNEK